jgi:hypothetical protein
MNAEQIVRMIWRLFGRQAARRGVEAALRKQGDSTPEARATAKAGRQSVQQAQRALRMMRRFGR